MAKVDIDKLSLEVMNQLKLYGEATVEIVENAVEETAKETVNELRVTSPVGATGDYSDSWKKKRDKNARGRYRYDMIVYSAKPDYRLTHLLEYGHALRRGGRKIGKAKAFPHIKNAEIHAEKRLINKIMKGIEGIRE